MPENRHPLQVVLGKESSVPILDVREIMKILPHRYPMLLIDRITELEPMVRARGYKNVTANEPMFTGHFPGNPLFPGVYMIEALAQPFAGKTVAVTHFAPTLRSADPRYGLVPGTAAWAECTKRC